MSRTLSLILPNSMAGTERRAPAISSANDGTLGRHDSPVSFATAERYDPEIIFPNSFNADLSI